MEEYRCIDGSCTEDSSASVSIILRRYERRLRKLSHRYYSMTLELHAILEAMKFICERTDASHWVICAHSKSALQIMMNIQTAFKNGEIVHCIAVIVEEASKQDHNIVF